MPCSGFPSSSLPADGGGQWTSPLWALASHVDCVTLPGAGSRGMWRREGARAWQLGPKLMTDQDAGGFFAVILSVGWFAAGPFVSLFACCCSVARRGWHGGRRGMMPAARYCWRRGRGWRARLDGVGIVVASARWMDGLRGDCGRKYPEETGGLVAYPHACARIG